MIRRSHLPGTAAKATAHISDWQRHFVFESMPMNYTDLATASTRRGRSRMWTSRRSVPATAQAMLNDDGSVVRVVHGPVPLWGTRRGEDVMLTDVLAFDLRVFDPGAPLFATRKVRQRNSESMWCLRPAIRVGETSPCTE